MRPPLASLVLAAVAAVVGGWVLIERGPHLLHSPPASGRPEVVAGTALPSGPQPRWAVDPTQVGPNLPPAGRSLFDFAMLQPSGDKLAYDIPFPFDALVRKVEERAGCAGRPCTRQVLIPLGRSLQRIAASPDFFEFPRVVVAVDGEGASGLLLKDRLYLGYQEKSNLLEVISYNELAGRFEFQIVRDYRAGGSPQVVYANRNVCTACHQNLAPLFSRQQWDETNANPAVAQRLVSSNAKLYGVPARRDIETPNAIDAAIHRANMLSVYQALWQYGCGDDPQHALACRRAALIAALQYRLSGERAYDAGDPGMREAVVATLTKVVAARWPNGMAIPNSEIPNRDPFGYRAGAAGLAMTEVAARFEPLAVRAPLDVWSSDGESMAARMIAGAAQVFSEQDMRLLDEQMARAAQANRAPTRNFVSKCEVSTAGADVRFRCRADDTATELAGRVSLNGDRVESGELAVLAVNREPTLRLLDATQGQRTKSGGMSMLSMIPGVDGRRARLPSGNAVEGIDLRWSKAGQGEATITVSEDFAPLRDAILALGNDSALLSARPLARANVMATLARDAQQWCCTQPTGFPAAQEDIDGKAAGDVPPLGDPFKKACGICHRSPERSPPNFLYGDAKRVSAAVTSCAPRIYARLSMWSVARDRREKVPMPPPRAAHDGMPPDQEYGPKPEILESLKSAVADILRKETGAEPNLQRLLEDGYENLRPCLPAGA